MYLIDTDVISEARKREKANPGVRSFFQNAALDNAPLYLSVVTIGELRQGVESLRHRGDSAQANRLERWLIGIAADFSASVLSFDEDMAHVWGKLRVPHPENPVDKQIAATALLHDLIVVTRNDAHFRPTGVKVLNPFA